MGMLAAEFSDDVGEVLLGAQALSFQDLHNGGHLPHVGAGRFFEETCCRGWGAGAYFPFGFHSCAILCASEIWAGVI